MEALANKGYAPIEELTIGEFRERYGGHPICDIKRKKGVIFGAFENQELTEFYNGLEEAVVRYLGPCEMTQSVEAAVVFQEKDEQYKPVLHLSLRPSRLFGMHYKATTYRAEDEAIDRVYADLSENPL